MLFSKRILTVKILEVTDFHIRLTALWLSSSLILKKLCMLVFLSVIENIVLLCPSFFVVFSHTLIAFNYSQFKRAVEREKNFIMPGHYKKIMPAQQPIRVRILL